MLPAAVCEVGQLGSAGVAVGEDDGVGSCRFDGRKKLLFGHGSTVFIRYLYSSLAEVSDPDPSGKRSRPVSWRHAKRARVAGGGNNT